MGHDNSKENKKSFVQYAPIAGIVLVVCGLLLLIDQFYDSHWISLGIPVLIGIIFIFSGFLSKRKLWLIPGFILFGIGSGLLIIFQKIFINSTIILIGWAIGVFAISWILLFLTLKFLRNEIHWWVLFVACISLAVSINFLLPKISLLNFVFTISIAISFCFICWGSLKKKLGLLIPGLLIFSIGAGIYFAWNRVIINGLIETGIMLVWFSLGWMTITVVSRIISKKFVWWPLIPGGVLAMVGSGLYIGGNPGNAVGFLQNTGSIGLILFGVYLILLKFGMNK